MKRGRNVGEGTIPPMMKMHLGFTANILQKGGKKEWFDGRILLPEKKGGPKRERKNNNGGEKYRKVRNKRFRETGKNLRGKTRGSKGPPRWGGREKTKENRVRQADSRGRKKSMKQIQAPGPNEKKTGTRNKEREKG